MFHLHLRRAMEKRGLSQTELAAKAGITPSQVSRWLSASSNPRIGMLRKISRILGVSPGALLDGKRAA